MVYSVLLEVSRQNTFALFFLPLLFYPNLLMLQEHLIKTHLLKTTVKYFWYRHVTIFIVRLKSRFSSKYNLFPQKWNGVLEMTYSFLVGSAARWCPAMAVHEPQAFHETSWWECPLHSPKWWIIEGIILGTGRERSTVSHIYLQ